MVGQTFDLEESDCAFGCFFFVNVDFALEQAKYSLDFLAGCICGSRTARVVKPFDFNVGKSALSHRLVVTAWCCNSASDTISMQILFGPTAEGLRVRKALVKAMSMSVRFSTPFSLKTLGNFWTMASAWGLQTNR